ETAALGAVVERANRIRRQRTETHCRDVEHAGRIRLLAFGPADADAKIVAVDFGRRQRVVDPFVLRGIQIEFAAERALVLDVFRTLVHERAFGMRKRHMVGVGLNHVLAQHRAEEFEKRADVRGDRKIAPQRALALEHVGDANQTERTADAGEPLPGKAVAPQCQRQCTHHKTQDKSEIALRQHAGSPVPKRTRIARGVYTYTHAQAAASESPSSRATAQTTAATHRTGACTRHAPTRAWARGLAAGARAPHRIRQARAHASPGRRAAVVVANVVGAVAGIRRFSTARRARHFYARGV